MPRPSRAASADPARRAGRRPGQPGPGAVEGDLPVGTPTVPSFGFSRLMREAVRGAVGEVAGDDEGAEAPAARRGALGSGQDDEDVGVDVGAEVLVAEEPPFVAVLDGPGGVGPDVAPALALGQEHPALPRLGRGRVLRRRLTISSRTAPGAWRSMMSAAPAGHAQPAVDGRLRLGHR